MAQIKCNCGGMVGDHAPDCPIPNKPKRKRGCNHEQHELYNPRQQDYI